MEYDQTRWDDDLDTLALQEFLSYYTGLAPGDQKFHPQTMMSSCMQSIIQRGALNCYIAQWNEAQLQILFSYQTVVEEKIEKSSLFDHLLSSGFYKDRGGKHCQQYYLIEAEQNQFTYLCVVGSENLKCQDSELCHSLAHNVIQAFLRLKGQEQTTCLQNRIKELKTSLFRLNQQQLFTETSGRVAHEINNFLMSLNGNLAILADQMEKGIQDPEMASRFHRLTDFSEILAQLTLHMTQNADPETLVEPLDINQHIRDVIQFIRPLEAKRNIDFELRLSPLPRFSMEKGRIYQIVLNLCNVLLKNRRQMTLVIETVSQCDQIFIRFFPVKLDFPAIDDHQALVNPFYFEADLDVSIAVDLIKEVHGILYSFQDENFSGFQVTFLCEPNQT